MKPIFVACLFPIAIMAASSAVSAQRGTPIVAPTPIDDSQVQPSFTTVGGVGGASVLPTTRTIPHWWVRRSIRRTELRTATTSSALIQTRAPARRVTSRLRRRIVRKPEAGSAQIH
jgi:hypothetical protein